MLLLTACDNTLRRQGKVIRCVAITMAFGAILLNGAFAAKDTMEFMDCGDPFAHSPPPYDYTSAADQSDPTKIPTVERFHFGPEVESLTKGKTSTNVLDDLDFVLRAIPNHHRALNAVARYDLSRGGIPPNKTSAVCWFDRAVRFKPDDGTVWMIFGNYKAGRKDYDGALEAYQKGKGIQPENIEIDYNMGLLYLKTGEIEKASESARIAYQKGFPLQGLRRELERRGVSVSN